MTDTQRVPGRYGRRPPSGKDAIRFGAILRTGAAIPAHPASEDYLGKLSDWQMLGNGDAGNCVAVTWANFRRLVTAFLATENYPTQGQVWEIYKTQNPDFDPDGSADTNGPGSAADQGMDIQTLLEYLVKVGGPDGVKAVAFAQVDYTNADELDAALAIFGSVWVGVNVLKANLSEFSHGKPWDYVKSSPDDGGHSVLAGGYLPHDTTFITWAAETEFTDAFRTRQVEETWVVVWPEHLGTAQFQAGIDLTALAAAYQKLTGRTLPTPTPEPPPAPPTPVSDADRVLAQAVRPWAMTRHTGKNEKAAEAFLIWLKAKGL